MECYLMFGLCCLIYQNFGLLPTMLAIFGLTVFIKKLLNDYYSEGMR